MILGGSLLIAYHLGCVLLNVLAAPSGPWPAMEGADMAMPPALVGNLHTEVALPYLRLVKLTHNYHFNSNRVGQPEAFLEVELQDEEGEVIKTVRFPDPKAPSSVRQRQAALAHYVTEDQPIQPSMIEKIPAPNRKIPEIPIWEGVPGDQRKLTLARIPENEVPRDRPVFRPSEWSLIVVRSLGRYLCREHGASRAEIVRKSKEPIPPRILQERQDPPETEELSSSYGRLPR
jgi:hypothetical protein